MYDQKEYQKNYYEENKERLNSNNREYYHLNKENNKEKRKKYSEENSESNKEKCKKWYYDNKERVKEYYEENKEKRKESKKRWRLKNKEKLKNDYNEWRLKNKDNINKNYKEYIKARQEIDPVFKLNLIIRKLISCSFKRVGYKKNSRSEKILGCSFEEFKIHIESKFEEWMTFDNHGKYNGEYGFGWDIDHIVELKNAETLEDVIKLNHYSNLRPLDSKINRVDRNRKES